MLCSCLAARSLCFCLSLARSRRRRGLRPYASAAVGLAWCIAWCELRFLTQQARRRYFVKTFSFKVNLPTGESTGEITVRCTKTSVQRRVLQVTLAGAGNWGLLNEVYQLLVGARPGGIESFLKVPAIGFGNCLNIIWRHSCILRT